MLDQFASLYCKKSCGIAILERNLTRFAGIARSLLGDDVRWVVELGARDCRETLGFEASFPQARIFSFECNPDMLPVCRAAVAGHEHIRLIEKAASSESGMVRFYPVDPATNPGASSLLRASGEFALEHYVQREVEVEAITLESFLAAESIPRIDLLWMDIQGAELAALQGLGTRIADVGLMHLEVEFERIYADQPLFADVRDHLAAHDFAFLGFTVYARHSADAVFANRRRFGAPSLLRALAVNPIVVRKRLQYARHRLKRRTGSG